MRKLEELSREELEGIVTVAQRTIEKIKVLFEEMGADRGRFCANTVKALNEIKKLNDVNAMRDAIDITIKAIDGEMDYTPPTIQ